MKTAWIAAAAFVPAFAIGLVWNPLGSKNENGSGGPARPPGPVSASTADGAGPRAGRAPASVPAAHAIVGAPAQKLESARPARDPEQVRLVLDKLGRDPDGRELATFMGRYYGGGEEVGAGAKLHSDFRAMLSDPKKGLRTVKAGLTAIPRTGFALERISLLEAAAELANDPSTRDEIRAIANEELTTNVIPARPARENAKTDEELSRALSTTPEMIIPQLAAGIAVALSETPQQALEVTMKGLEAQPDAFVRSRMAEGLIKVYPEQKDPLLAAAKAKGIVLTLALGEPPKPAAPAEEGK